MSYCKVFLFVSLFSGCILRQVFQKYWDWHCHCMARYEVRTENYKIRPTHRFPSVCNHCLQLLCSHAISQIMSYSVFSIKFLFFMIKPVCRTLSIYSYICIFTVYVLCMHMYKTTSLFLVCFVVFFFSFNVNN